MKKNLAVDIQLERHEAKYVVPHAVAREAIKFAIEDIKPDEISVIFRIRMEN